MDAITSRSLSDKKSSPLVPLQACKFMVIVSWTLASVLQAANFLVFFLCPLWNRACREGLLTFEFHNYAGLLCYVILMGLWNACVFKLSQSTLGVNV